MTAPVAEPTAPAGNPIQSAIAKQMEAVQTGTSAARLAPEGPLPPGVTVPEPDQPVAEPAPPTPPETPEPAPETVPDVEPGPEPIVVALPARRPGEQDVEIETSDPVVADRLRNMLRSYERKADSTRRYEEAHAIRQEAEEFQTMVATNPAHVVQQTLDPERQRYLALSLLTSDEHWGGLSETLVAMLSDQSGNTMRVIRAELQAEGLRLQQEAQTQIQGRRAADRNAKLVDRSLDAIIPASLTGPQREAWKRDAMNELASYASQHNLQSLDPLHLPMLLQHRLRAWNTDPQQAAQQLYATLTGRQGAPSGQPASGSPPAPPTGPQLVRAAASRRAAAAAAPSGAVSPPAQVAQMPKDIKTVNGAIEYRRQQLGLPSS